MLRFSFCTAQEQQDTQYQLILSTKCLSSLTASVCLDKDCKNKSQKWNEMKTFMTSMPFFFFCLISNLSNSDALDWSVWLAINWKCQYLTSREGETTINHLKSWTLKSFEWSGYSWYIPGVMAFSHSCCFFTSEPNRIDTDWINVCCLESTNSF